MIALSRDELCVATSCPMVVDALGYRGTANRILDSRIRLSASFRPSKIPIGTQLLAVSTSTIFPETQCCTQYPRSLIHRTGMSVVAAEIPIHPPVDFSAGILS